MTHHAGMHGCHHSMPVAPQPVMVAPARSGFGNGFALVIVLFILLIIIGATIAKPC